MNYVNELIAEQDRHRQFMYACFGGKLGKVREYMSHGEEAKRGINRIGVFCMTPLMIATSAGHLHIVMNLVANGANLDIQQKEKRYTAAILAARKGWIDILQYLLDCGADPTIKDKEGKDIFETLARYRYCKKIGSIYEYLLDMRDENEVDKMKHSLNPVMREYVRRQDIIREFTLKKPKKWIFANYQVLWTLIILSDKGGLPYDMMMVIGGYLFL